MTLRRCPILLVEAICGASLLCAVGQIQAKKSDSAVPPPAAYSGQDRTETYDSWMAGFKTGPLTRAFEESHPLELAITIISGDDVVQDAKKAAFMGPNYSIVTTRFSVSNEGSVVMTRVTAMAIQGGGPGKLPDKDFKKLGPLIADLPDDHSRLPPKGRRLVVQAVTPVGMLARAYDKANLPESVLEMLRVVDADTWPIFPFAEFKPDQLWDKAEVSKASEELRWMSPDYGDRRILALSPDQSLKIVEINLGQFFDPTVHVERLKNAREKPNDSTFTSLRIEDARSGALIHELHEPLNGKQYVYMYAARFTPDGRKLLVLSSLPDIRIYDASTWQQLDRLPGVAAGTVAYYPSADWKHGVAAFPSGEVSLMEAGAGRKLARIDFDDELQSVSYSPDGSQVAVVTVGHDADGAYRCHLRIWETATGILKRELMPMEATPRDGFGEPVWWRDGKYLLSPTREGHFGRMNVVGIWNVESGRYRGALVGCDKPPDEWAHVVLDGTRFFKECGYDGLLMWDVEGDIKKIQDFEKSLPN